jgi:endoglucanase
MASCKEDAAVISEITLAKEQIAFDTNAGNSILAIKTNTAWTISSADSWCTVSPSSGGAGTKQITVTVSKNLSDGTRTTKLTVKAGDLSKEVTITQTLEKLQLDKDSVSFDTNGGEFTLNIQATASYSVVTPSWITLKSTSTDGKSQIFTVNNNGLIYSRQGKIIYTSGLLKDSVVVTQTGKSISIPADASGMSSDAKTLASKMYLGWNIGNTLEAPGGENAWGNPNVSQLLIDSIKAAGFNAVRIPCAWDSHLSDAANYTINPTWLARVKEVVDYCYKNNMYVIVNIHWDGGWLENNPTYAKQAAVNAKQKALWEQIAVYFRNYDEHLLFAGTNEVHADYNTPTTENITVQESYNQTFVNAVRSTGGKNYYRNLIIQSYNTNINYAYSNMTMSTDVVSNRLFAEVHYYDPWDFCGDTSASMKYYWGSPYSSLGVSSYGQEDFMRAQFAKMKTKFVDKGIPVILGEFGAMRRSTLTGTSLTNHLASRAYFYQYLVQQARNNGIIPFLWDTGISGNNDMGIFVRSTGVASDKQALAAIKAGAAESSYPY